MTGNADGLVDATDIDGSLTGSFMKGGDATAEMGGQFNVTGTGSQTGYSAVGLFAGAK